MGPRPITGSMIYDAHSCLHRVAKDLTADPARRDAVSPFVAMLWRAGSAHEDEIVAQFPVGTVDLRQSPEGARRDQTDLAMAQLAPFIVGGEIAYGDLLGRPAVLHLQNGTYVAGDVKSGAGEEGSGKLKLVYGVQLAHYAHILECNGAGAGDRAFVIDVAGEWLDYRIDEPVGRTTIRQRYQELTGLVRSVRDGGLSRPALSATCKLCHWRTSCKEELHLADDLTLIPQLGRSIRDSLIGHVASVNDLASCDLQRFAKGKTGTVISGLGAARLKRFQDRARLICDPEGMPYAREELGLPLFERELMFDIEADPGRDIVYLHGIVERRRTGSGTAETFHAFFCEDETREAERDAFARAFAFLTEDPASRTYYWSKYERTAYRRLQERYPDVCTAEAVEQLFDPERAIDLLFDVVMPKTEWPTNDHSIKSIAKWCGFKWRDVDPSGAASIEWYDRWVATRDPDLRQRILDYNEDDCRATRVVLDALRSLPVRLAAGD